MFLTGTPLYWYFDSPDTIYRRERSYNVPRRTRGNSGRGDVGRNAPAAAGGRLPSSGGRGGGGGGGGGSGSGRRGKNKMLAQQQDTSTPTGQQHNRTRHTDSQRSSLPALYQKSCMEKRLLSDFMPGHKFNQKNDSSRKSHKAAIQQNLGKQAAEAARSSCKNAELIFPTKYYENGNTLPTGRKDNLKINVPHLKNSNNRCAEDNIGQTVPEVMADTNTQRLEHSKDSCPQTITLPMQTRTQPEELDSRLTSVLDLSGEMDFREPTSPAFSDNDCSFMTYSSDGISVIISNGGCVLHDEPLSIVPHTAESDFEKLKKALCIEVPKQDNETDDGVKSVKSISPVYTPGSTCPDLTFSGSPPLLNSLDSISPVDSAWSSRTLSPLSYECHSPAVLTKTASTAATSGSFITTATPATPATPDCSKIPSSNSSSSPGNVDETWLWLPAIIPPLTLLLRWIWFPAPPPNLPWRDPVLKENEKAAVTAHYYLRGHPPDAFNIQYIEGRWKKDPHWRWIPSNGDMSGGGHWYELPTPPEPAHGAWYLVWPAELPMSSSPFIPGQGTWLTGSYFSKNNVMPTMLLPQKNLPVLFI